MKLDETILPLASITGEDPVKKLTVYEYLWSDMNAVEESGLGPLTITVKGTCQTCAEKDAIREKCNATGEKKLYHTSPGGSIGTDDRYYLVRTHPAKWAAETVDTWDYTISCVAADPRVYDAATEAPI